MNEHQPKISVFTTCKNGGKYLRETLDSIYNQTFKDFEIVLIDGGSTDDTIDILKSYNDPRLRWISEPDNDANEGFYKALMMTRGEYVMCMPVSDCYVDNNWFSKCIDILDNDINISLVFGNVYNLLENNDRVIAFPEWIKKPPPTGEKFFPFWLATRCFIPELTYCVRSSVYKKCFPDIRNVIWNYQNPPIPNTDVYFNTHNCFLKFIYNFNVNGYLPKYLPIIASFGRQHKNSRNNKLRIFHQHSNEKYVNDILQLKKDVFSGAIEHYYLNGSSKRIRKIEKNRLAYLQMIIMKYRIFNEIHFKTSVKNEYNIRSLIAKAKSYLKNAI